MTTPVVVYDPATKDPDVLRTLYSGPVMLVPAGRRVEKLGAMELATGR